jgi:hypothetical protein
MDLRTPPHAVTALASFVRDRLAEVSESLAPLWNRRDGQLVPAEHETNDRSVVAAARQLAFVIMGAAAPFAPTSYSRARLIRQMHASGLLTDEHVRQTRRLLELAGDVEPGDVSGAPR